MRCSADKIGGAHVGGVGSPPNGLGRHTLSRVLACSVRRPVRLSAPWSKIAPWSQLRDDTGAFRAKRESERWAGLQSETALH